jgi:hypothetical protein
MNVRRLVLSALSVVLAGCTLFTDTAALVLENDAAVAVREVYLAPPDAAAWGENLLDGLIAPGATVAFRGIAPGTWDVLVRDAEEGWSAWVGEVFAPWERHRLRYGP